jgi:hypothetical protein
MHEEDFVWQAFFVPADFTVKQAADFLMSLVANATVWPKSKEVRIVKYHTGEVLDPEAKFGEVVKPGSPSSWCGGRLRRSGGRKKMTRCFG